MPRKSEAEKAATIIANALFQLTNFGDSGKLEVLTHVAKKFEGTNYVSIKHVIAAMQNAVR